MKVFIGYDSKQVGAFHTCMESILLTSSQPVSVTPLKKETLPYASSKVGSTEFSYTRFLVPHLSKYKGISLYCDSDFIFTSDITELFCDIAYEYEEGWEVAVCKHEYTPKNEYKFFNNKNENYPRKNWSSLMMFNNSKCTQLTPYYVNMAMPNELHQLQWADRIEEIPKEWNFLVGEYQKPVHVKPKGIHYTNGGPWLEDYIGCDFNEEYFKVERRIK